MTASARFLIGCLAACLLACLAAAPGPAAAQPVDASRIVTLGGSVTETVYALGAGDQVVGVDASSLYPEAATEKPSVGYFRQVPAEGVLALEPTLVLALDGTGPPDVLDQIRSAGVAVRTIPDAPSVDGAKEKIRTIARLVGQAERGADLIAQMEADLDEARQLRSASEATPSVLFIYARGAGTMNVAGEGTSAATMIELAGGTNAAGGFDGYKPMTAESVVAAEPEVLLLLDRGLESVGGVDGLLDQPGVSLTPAADERRVVAMDDLLLLGFGPRLGEAVKRLTQKLHPALVP